MNSSKKFTRTKLKKQLWKVVSSKIKERDHQTCWHCGKRMDNPSALHCSHILPKGEYPNYEYSSWNLKTLCMHCHLHWWHKNPIAASLWLQKEHLEVYDKAILMMEKYDESVKRSDEELLELKLKLEK